MIVELKEQLESSKEQVPKSVEEVKGLIENYMGDDRLIKDFLLMRRISEY
jgi:hypothetical protein